MEKGLAHFEARFWGAFCVAQAATHAMRGSGSIIFMIGAFSQKPMKGRAATTAAQSAVNGLAVDLAPVHINTVIAVLTDTGMWAKMERSAKEGLFADYSRSVPVGRFGAVNDVASMALVAMKNPYVTGTKIVVDGCTTAL